MSTIGAASVASRNMSLRARVSLVLQNLKSTFLPSTAPPYTYPGNDDVSPSTGILQDIQKLGFKDYQTLLAFLNAAVTGSYDDDSLLLENLIVLLAKLPPHSREGKQLTDGFINQLWGSLDHPPVSSLGQEFKYRAADGSGNNIRLPSLGAANTAYARSTPPLVLQSPNPPDPGLIFDLLMARGDKFVPHPQGFSSMFFYMATLIIHDLFQTSSADFNINLTSSYADLSPLYGRNWDEQKEMRVFKDGLIKPDCFSSKRLLGFPPGCGAFLVMFNRFHNYVVTQLAHINEGNRFARPSSSLKAGSDEARAAWEKYDNDLFQTGRLITCGLWGNIILMDYARSILALNRSGSTWHLDPRTKEGKNIFSQPSAQGVGNQVSAEFNLIYRWHSAISERDEKWTVDEFKRLLGGKDPSKAGMAEIVRALAKFEAEIPEQPEQRTFGGLQRSEDGTFDDDGLVKLLQEAVEDPAGAFGANQVPDCLRSVEMLGIIQSRYWNVATLNEFRQFFGLTKHDTFLDINPDPQVAAKLMQLYDSPDSVELYPGLVAEKAKPPMTPGAGLCPNYTTSRAILSDAITLIRGDRFLTVDFTPKNVTNWGFNEVSYDLNVDQGQVMYKLFSRAFPDYFAENSVYAHLPFILPSENKAILEALGTADTYSWDKPRYRGGVTVVRSHGAVASILQNRGGFRPATGSGASLPRDAKTLRASPNHDKLAAYCVSAARDSLVEHSLLVGASTSEVDVVRDVLAFVAGRVAVSPFCYPPSRPHAREDAEQDVAARLTRAAAQCLDYYLGDGKEHLGELYRLAHLDTKEADQTMLKYVLEGCRLRNTVALHFEAVTQQTVTDYPPCLPDPADPTSLAPIPNPDPKGTSKTATLAAGSRVLLDLTSACHDSAAFVDPNAVKLDRPVDSYPPASWGYHDRLGAEGTRAAVTALFKVVVGLRGLKRAEGLRGELKSLPLRLWGGQVGRGVLTSAGQWSGLRTYMTADQSAYSPTPSTMRIRWEN